MAYKIIYILNRNFLLYVWNLGSEEIWIFNKSVQHYWNLQGQGLPVSCWVSWVKRYVNVEFLPTQYETSGSNPTSQKNKCYKILKILCVYMCVHNFFILKNIVQTGSKTLNLNGKCFYGCGKVLVILLCPTCLSSVYFLNNKTLAPRG